MRYAIYVDGQFDKIGAIEADSEDDALQTASELWGIPVDDLQAMVCHPL